MKQFIKMILYGSMMLVREEVAAQSRSETRTLEISYNKTTSLIFPAIIKSVDRGSRDILAQKAKGVENILQLKAARHGFLQTNLTVITSDGNIHQFSVAYGHEPEDLVLNVGDVKQDDLDTPLLIFDSDLTETQMEIYASKIVNSKRSIRMVNTSKYKIGLSLRGIYIRDKTIFYHVRIRNQSNIHYDVDFLRFYVQDKQKMKRTASQEVDVKPVYAFGSDQEIRGQTTTDVVYALEKFTIPEAKRLVIEMFEKNGGRNLSLSIRNRTIVNADLID
jgi:conjugative transposon TraN protein